MNESESDYEPVHESEQVYQNESVLQNESVFQSEPATTTSESVYESAFHMI